MTKPKLDHLADDKLREILMIKEKLKQIDNRDQAQKSFLSYIKAVWDGFIEGEHHKLFARKLEAVARGKIKRLIVTGGKNLLQSHLSRAIKRIQLPQLESTVCSSDIRNQHACIFCDTSSSNNRVVCTGDNLYSAGARSADDYIILGNLRQTSEDGHNHDNINSPTVVLADDQVTQAKIADNAVGRAQLLDDAVGQAELETTTGSKGILPARRCHVAVAGLACGSGGGF